MHIYADYEWYKAEFKGTAISSSEAFDSAVIKASRFVDTATHGRITDVTDNVKNAVCAAAEIYAAADSTHSSPAVSSEKVGDYSVSFRSASEAEKDRKYALMGAVKMWLSDTGLLYGGVYP